MQVVAKFCDHRKMVRSGGAWGSRAVALGGAWRRVRPPMAGWFVLLASVVLCERVGSWFVNFGEVWGFIGLIIDPLLNGFRPRLPSNRWMLI